MSSQKAKIVSGELTLATPISANMSLPALKLSVSMGESTTPDEAMAAVDTVCASMNQRRSELCALQVIAAKMVREIQVRELYKPAYPDFEHYLTHLDETYGLTRTVITDALMAIKVFPKITPDDVKGMKVVNFTNAARAAKHMQPKAAERLLKEASKLSVVKFREKLEGDGLLKKRGRPEGGRRTTGEVLLRIMVPASLSKRFKERVAVLGVKESKYFRTLLDLESAAS